MSAKRKREATLPRWLKLDNAAKIYPPSRSRHWAAMFRLSITLEEPVDPILLQRAEAEALGRMPSFAYGLRRGFFWYYLERLPGAPPVQPDVANPMVRLNLKENGHFMFRVRYYDRRVAVEIFHALTDGTGGLTFLLTMTAEYLRLKHGATIAPGGQVLDVRAPFQPEEIEDSFLRYAREASISRIETPAYSVRGTLSNRHFLRITTGILPTARVIAKAREYGASVTVFLVSVLVQAILDIQRADPSPRKRRQMVKVSVPVNLRPYYGSVTLRNFASYVNVGVLGSLGEYSLEEIICQVKHQMGMEVTEKRLNARFTGNVGSERHPIIRGMPLFLKAPFMKMMFLLQGDRYCSSTLSNLGVISLPEGMQPYVKRLDFLLGAPSANPVNGALISVGEHMYLNFSRLIWESDVERGFFTALVKLGIPVRIESNQR